MHSCPVMGILSGIDAQLENALDLRAKVYLCSFMRSSWSLVTLVSAYLLLVLLGPRLMKGRRPFSLKKVLIVYNLLQVLANGIFFYRMIPNYFFSKEVSYWCQPVPYNRTDEFGTFVYSQTVFFFSLKVLDMMDTVFFVLRNKQNQITFLHVFHHLSLVTVMWFALLLYPGGNMSITCAINAAVHVIMYTYYLLSALDLPQLSVIKPYITTVQLIQFVLNTGHLFLTAAFGNCESPVIFQGSVVFLNICFYLLFMQFYQKSYNNKGTQARKTK